MKRYSAFDPREYQDWRPDHEAISEFRARLVLDPNRKSLIEALTSQQHLAIYRGLVRNRLHDISLKRWVRQGIISKAWLGTGEEAVTIGAVHALRQGDVVGPMIRNAGACHEMGMSLASLFRGYLGTEDSPTRGRDLHVGDLAKGVVAPISMVGALVPVCAGIALSFKLRGESNVALTWAGEGSTRTTAFHEGLMCAKRLQLPLVVFVQDNQIALGTPVAAHSAAPMEATATIYGAMKYTCDGNNVLDVYATTSLASELCRFGRGPVVITARTFRMGGHATHDEGESRRILPEEQFVYWGKRDPIGMYETYLADASFRLSASLSNREALERAEAEVERDVEHGIEEALASRERAVPDASSQRSGVFAER
ncbi:MAG TPA: thiamine pyrophosphate-dependent dehydrogenase E1 component subunit alpha [Vicinamibacteria bacterium]|nr:thiamine pyrophosphate-dependent dehydrogenase E1 component subunit alpha [Vicinamibacteria bacterium]